jgi:hypothetical protein
VPGEFIYPKTIVIHTFRRKQQNHQYCPGMRISPTEERKEKTYHFHRERQLLMLESNITCSIISSEYLQEPLYLFLYGNSPLLVLVDVRDYIIREE